MFAGNNGEACLDMSHLSRQRVVNGETLTVMRVMPLDVASDL